MCLSLGGLSTDWLLRNGRQWPWWYDLHVGQASCDVRPWPSRRTLRASCMIMSVVSNVTPRQFQPLLLFLSGFPVRSSSRFTVLVSFRFSSQIQFEAHERKLCGPAEQCDICGRIFKFAITLERHKNRSHVESKCNGSFTLTETLVPF